MFSSIFKFIRPSYIPSCRAGDPPPANGQSSLHILLKALLQIPFCRTGAAAPKAPLRKGRLCSGSIIAQNRQKDKPSADENTFMRTLTGTRLCSFTVFFFRSAPLLLIFRHRNAASAKRRAHPATVSPEKSDRPPIWAACPEIPG